MMARDGEFTWLEGEADPAAQSQVLMWDGRIDNREHLRWRLASALSDAKSDAALVLAAYRRWGVAGLGEIIGDWSAVILDGASRTIVLASDYAGVRPLFYHHRPGKVFWSSRLESLVAATDLGTLDDTYIHAFLTLGGPSSRTPYAGIGVVPAGHAVVVDARALNVRSFWTLPTGDSIRYGDERRYEEQLRGLFREAVAVRLQTSTPVIAELSGGLDSSSVVSMASRLIRTGAVPAPRLIGVSYVHRESTDVPFIREVETVCGIEGVHLSTDEHPLIAEVQVDTAMPEAWGPLHGSAMAVARRLNAQVFLTGQNGDLVMGNWFDDSLQVAASLRRRRVGDTLAGALAWSKVLRVPVAWILWQASRAALRPGWASPALYAADGLSASARAETSLHERFAAPAASTEMDGAGSREWMLAPPERRKHFHALARMRELRQLQVPQALRGLDYTHPFAHRPLVEFLMSVPADILCRPGEPRRLMRRALGAGWPPRVQARRSKSLFGAPWHDALRPLAVGLLAARRWEVVERGWIDRRSLAARLQHLIDGLPCNEPQLRQVILLEYWLRNRRQEPSEDMLRIA